MRVKLIPTGRCELLGLSECLGRVFPEHSFETVAARVEPDGERVPFDGFTSSRLSPSLVPGNLLKVVQQLASEVHPGRDGRRRARRSAAAAHFETDDAAFSADDGSACTALNAQNARKRKPERPQWLLPARPELPDYRRERHPKAYLAWLCRDPEDKRCCSTYRESRGGADALRALSWPAVLRTPAHARFARTFLRDLADVLGPPALALGEGEEHPLLARSEAPQDRVLRNL